LKCVKTFLKECGHAMIRYLQDEKALHKLTIIPRGKTLGVAYYIPNELDEYIRNRQDAIQIIEQALGGMAAEEVFYGKNKTTTGVSSDLQSATDMARQMVTRYGMSDLGAVDYASNEDKLSSETKRFIDIEVQKIIQECYDNTKEKITKQKKQIESVAEELIKYGTLSGQEFSDIIQGKKIRTGTSKTYVKFD
jgi:ATP-dependent Zn protease